MGEDERKHGTNLLLRGLHSWCLILAKGWLQGGGRDQRGIDPS
jgi:hypothetical protein